MIPFHNNKAAHAHHTMVSAIFIGFLILEEAKNENAKMTVANTAMKIYFQLIDYTRIIKAISKGVVLIISPFLEKLYRRSSYLLYNQNKHCGFVSIELQLRLFGGDSDRSGLSELVISWVTLDVLFA